MTPRKLGSTELEIAPLVLGGNVFGWTADETTSFAVLDAFVDAGDHFLVEALAGARAPPRHDACTRGSRSADREVARPPPRHVRDRRDTRRRPCVERPAVGRQRT